MDNTIPELLGLIEYSLERAKFYDDYRGGLTEARFTVMCMSRADDRFDYPEEWFHHLMKYVEAAVEAVDRQVTGTGCKRSDKLSEQLTPTDMLAFAAAPIFVPSHHEGAPGSSEWELNAPAYLSGKYRTDDAEADAD